MIGNAILLALREIRRNLLRAILTTLGIVIGVGAVIAIVTLGNGVTAGVASSIGSLGRNLITLQPGTRRGPGAGGNVGAQAFTADDVAAIKREVGNISAVASLVMRGMTVVAGNQNHPTQVAGTDNAYMGARDWPLESGRVFTEAEERSGRAVCILGQTVRKFLFGVQDPLGSEIRLGPIPCEVIGVLTAKGQNTFGQDQDDIVIMPLRAVQRRAAGNDDIGIVLISAVRAEDVAKIKKDVTELMRERRHRGQGIEDDFRADDMAEIAGIMQTTTGMLTAFLAAIAAISLLVGGIGIMNIMLVSVTERTREIGIRLAIGARERDVLIQFLVEATTMSVLGGLIGTGVGFGVSAVAARYLAVPYVPSLGAAVIAVMFAAAIGMAFGFFPARRAARLDPIEALRHE